MVKVYEEYDSQGEEEEDGLNRKMVLASKSLMVQIKYRIDDLPEATPKQIREAMQVDLAPWSRVICSLLVASFPTAVLDTYEMRPLKNTVTDKGILNKLMVEVRSVRSRAPPKCKTYGFCNN